MNIDYVVVGTNVRFYRLLAKMSQEALAEHADVSRVFISVIERGEKPPSLDTLIGIANALHVSVDALLSGSINASGDGGSQHSPFFDCTPEEFSVLMAAAEGLKSIIRRYKVIE